MNNRHNTPREAKRFGKTPCFRWSRRRAIGFDATIWRLSEMIGEGRVFTVDVCVDDLTMALSLTLRNIAQQLKQAKMELRRFNPS
jgi:hypothetical protein